MELETAEVNKIKLFLESNPKYGYKCVKDFCTDAIRHALYPDVHNDEGDHE